MSKTPFKVGQKVWTIESGWVMIEVISSDTSDTYPIETEYNTYTLDGKRFETDLVPSMFHDEPVWPDPEPPKPKYPKLEKFLDLVKETLETRPKLNAGLCYYWAVKNNYRCFDNNKSSYELWEFYKKITKYQEDTLGKEGVWNKQRIDYCKWILNNLPGMYEDFLMFCKHKND